MYQGRSYDVPLEELDDSAWTELSPLRPKHYSILSEWLEPSWSFAVTEGWQDYDDPPLEERQVRVSKLRRVKAKRKSKPKSSFDESYDALWIKDALKITKPSRIVRRKKHKRTIQRPRVTNSYEEVLKYWAVKPVIEIAWSGKQNNWAQLCFYCETVVPVGQGTWGKSKLGDWEAAHWNCFWKDKTGE